jgi:hypothetical protein
MTTTQRISYWDRNATYSKWLEENFESLVKPSGPSDTVEGELIRAVSKLNHDWGNNGMCNNTSGACNFIAEVIDFTDAERSAWDEVYSECNTGGYSEHGKLLDHITTISDAVIKYVISRNNNYEPLVEGDMFDFADPDYDCYDEDEYDCSEEGYYDSMGHYHEED